MTASSLDGYCVVCDKVLPYRPGPRARFCKEHDQIEPRCTHGVVHGFECFGCQRVGLVLGRLPVTGHAGDPTALPALAEWVAELRAVCRQQIADVRARDLTPETRDALLAYLRQAREDGLADLCAGGRGAR